MYQFIKPFLDNRMSILRNLEPSRGKDTLSGGGNCQNSEKGSTHLLKMVISIRKEGANSFLIE